MSSVVGRFNGGLSGKSFVCLEEMAHADGGQWHQAAAKLKDIITGTSISIENKYQAARIEDNNINLMVITNHCDSLKVDADDRRWVFLDLSTERVGDFAYLAKLDEHARACGKEFYKYLLSVDLRNWNPRKLPETATKADIKRDQLPDALRFVLEQFMLDTKGIDEPAQTFYKKYQSWHTVNVGRGRPLSQPMLNKQLVDQLGVAKKGKRFHGSNPTLAIIASYKDLYQAFEKKGLLHETDDLQRPSGLETHDTGNTAGREQRPRRPGPSEISPALPGQIP